MRRAEAATGGEIVVTVAAACDDYPEAAWRGAAGGAVLAVALAVAVHRLAGLWGGSLLLWAFLPALAGAAAGALASLVPAVRRRLLADATVTRRVEREAAAAFLAREVFATRDRTGILLFVALFEHRVVVLADSGIAACVAADTWHAITDRLAAGLRRKEAASALVRAVEECGELLAVHVARRQEDVNELPDEPQWHDV